ncbi:MAG TPA: fibrinogen-like YCDxxxxGGGW domain-containing protein, partial [Polyangiaceae bacterium]|nr:fibrinogen-like YCDxxxxGGGW domain-containing protein [Polyangiaceae bacterium]
GHAGQLDVWLNRVCLANFCDDDPDLTCFSESLATARVAAGECGPVPSGMGSTWAEGDSGAPPEDAGVDTGATSLDATSTDDAAHDAPNDTPADGEVLPPGDSGPDAREPDAALDASPDSSDSGPCDSRTECDRGFNCHGHRCLATPGNCAALKRDYPDLPDGVYWLKPNANSLLLAYCDMSRAVDLCNEQPADHRSVTRDGSSLPFVLTSVLDLPAKECLIWAVHNAVDNLPFSALVSAAGASLDTCQALGFRGDAMIEYCEYGATKGSCGFAVEQSNYDWYGNQCFGCTLNEGSFASYRRQGPIQIGAIISSVDGTTKTRCRVE